jgi:isovaleryl-CoA dehydrogenase
VSYQDALTQVIEGVVRPTAADIDRTGEFPRASIDALHDAGLLALTVPTKFGGGGKGLQEACDVVRQLSHACGSTALVVTMHYSAVAVLAALGRKEVLHEIARQRHLTTLAFSEVGSRSQFWVPMGSAKLDGDDVLLDGQKSWVTSAHEATSYVWSSRPLSNPGPMSLWLVRADTPGLSITGEFDGLGLRGNDSCPVVGQAVRVPRDSLLGEDGAGRDLALATVLPYFLLMNASASVGLMQAVTDSTTAHLNKTQLSHLGETLAEQLPARMTLARMRISTDQVRSLVDDTLVALQTGSDRAELQVLEVKAAADERGAVVADMAMQACGGAAFRKELNIERRFRDSRAARVMAPTTDALLDFVGRALCGMPILEST